MNVIKKETGRFNFMNHVTYTFDTGHQFRKYESGSYVAYTKKGNYANTTTLHKLRHLANAYEMNQEVEVKKLNAIQILDLQDLAKIEAGKIEKRMQGALDGTGAYILSVDLKRIENAIEILDSMFEVALREESQKSN
jgi:predicted RNase H-like nuclease